MKLWCSTVLHALHWLCQPHFSGSMSQLDQLTKSPSHRSRISSKTLRPKMSPFKQLYIMARALAIFMVGSACCLEKNIKSVKDVWQKDVKKVWIGTKSSRTSNCSLISYCWFFRVAGHKLSWRLIFAFGWFVRKSVAMCRRSWTLWAP